MVSTLITVRWVLKRMGGGCAVCGDDSVYLTVSPPQEWRTFLRRRRHFKGAEGFVAIPACSSCYFRVRNLVEADTEMAHYDMETRKQFELEIEELLTGLNLRRLITDENDDC
jgi:hypothetical protein